MTIELTEALERHRPMLDEIFGRGEYELDNGDPDLCVIRGRAAEVALAYDEGDRWVTCLVKPLLVPDEMSESYPIDDWLRARGQKAPCRPRGELDDRQVVAELRLLNDVVNETLADPQVARDAACFLLGYHAAWIDSVGPHCDRSF